MGGRPALHGRRKPEQSPAASHRQPGRRPARRPGPSGRRGGLNQPNRGPQLKRARPTANPTRPNTGLVVTLLTFIYPTVTLPIEVEAGGRHTPLPWAQPSRFVSFVLTVVRQRCIVSFCPMAMKRPLSMFARPFRPTPELYFSRLVVLGEGDSEQVVLPRVLAASGIAEDDASVSVVPLGGRHVNHFWRSLNEL
jgi:hypothetical protein